MPARRLGVRGLCALSVLLATACGTSPIVGPGFRTPSPPGASSPSSSPSSSSTSTGSGGSSSSSSSASSGTAAASITFGPCSGANVPPRAVCGSLQVPLDYSDPAKGTIRINVVKVPAVDPAQRIGSLLLNPGGPGDSGVDFVEGDMQSLGTLNRRFDIVGFDPRGTTGPDAVSCLTTSQLDAVVALDPVADTPAKKQALVDEAKQFAQACAQKSSRLLPYVGTDNAARDMDSLRTALGDAKLSYLGFSYGTDLGAHYAQLFPTHVRALVLDGDYDTSIPPLTAGQQQADSLENDYQEFLRRCSSQGACPLGSDPGAAISRYLSELDAHPVTAADGRTITRGFALTALLTSVYYTDIWNQAYVIWAEAIAGNVRGIELLTDEITGRTASGFDHSLEAGQAIDCADFTVPTDPGTYDADAAAVEGRDPWFGDMAVYGWIGCAYWPVHGHNPQPLSVSGAPPILLVGATNDPATPYAWSQSMQRQIPGSVLITRTGYGHTSYDRSSCIADRVDAYLFDLTVPPAGITCATDAGS